MRPPIRWLIERSPGVYDHYEPIRSRELTDADSPELPKSVVITPDILEAAHRVLMAMTPEKRRQWTGDAHPGLDRVPEALLLAEIAR